MDYSSGEMIAHLRGLILAKHPNQVVLECNGVGYDTTIPISTYTALPETGEAKLWVHTHVREDAIQLFGFATPEERTVFERLISVTGIGPKLAITILSGLPVHDLVSAIRAEQVDRLVRIPGVGRKTGERLILELKDKLESVALGAPTTPLPVRGPVLNPLEQDVLSALLNLGCARPAAEVAVQKAKANGTPQEFELLFRKSMEFIR